MNIPFVFIDYVKETDYCICLGTLNNMNNLQVNNNHLTFLPNGIGRYLFVCLFVCLYVCVCVYFT